MNLTVTQLIVLVVVVVLAIIAILFITGVFDSDEQAVGAVRDVVSARLS